MVPKEVITQIGLRVPETLRLRLQEEAERGSRSINAEMVRRLEESLSTDERVQEMSERIAALEASVQKDGETIRTLSLALAAATPGALAAALKRSGWDIKPEDRKALADLESGEFIVFRKQDDTK